MYPTFGISVDSKDWILGKIGKMLTKCDRMRNKISGFRAFAKRAKFWIGRPLTEVKFVLFKRVLHYVKGTPCPHPSFISLPRAGLDMNCAIRQSYLLD